jgi:hypothetical protein
MSYALNLVELRRAVYIDTVPRGAQSADFPVEQPTGFERVDEVIESPEIGAPPSRPERTATRYGAKTSS